MSYDIPRKVQQLGVDIQPEQLKFHNKRVRLAKQFTFDSAHHLFCYEGKCKSLHGHTYQLEVTMVGRPDERGIAIDFGDMKRITKDRVVDVLDHRYINEVLPPMNTTAENMVVWMFAEIQSALTAEGWSPRVELEKIRLWETPTSFAEVTKDMMEEEDE